MGTRSPDPAGPPAERSLLTPPRIRALLAAHGLRPVRALGQNYLADPNTARKVVRLAGVRPGETVLEVGPGLGSLTLALRDAGVRVVAVEADARLLPALEEVLGGDPGVSVTVADALHADLGALAPGSRRLVANLPYGIAAPLVLRVLAPVSRRVFVPEPHVDSVLVGVARRPHPALAGLGYPRVARVIDAAFSQRRKTLRNALRTLGLDAGAVEALGRAAGVDLGLRAERLDVPAFAALARNVDPAPGRG